MSHAGQTNYYTRNSMARFHIWHTIIYLISACDIYILRHNSQPTWRTHRWRTFYGFSACASLFSPGSNAYAGFTGARFTKAHLRDDDAISKIYYSMISLKEHYLLVFPPFLFCNFCSKLHTLHMKLLIIYSLVEMIISSFLIAMEHTLFSTNFLLP